MANWDSSPKGSQEKLRRDFSRLEFFMGFFVFLKWLILSLLSFKGVYSLQNIYWWRRPKTKIENHNSPNTWALLSCLRCSHSGRILCQGLLHPGVDVASRVHGSSCKTWLRPTVQWWPLENEQAWYILCSLDIFGVVRWSRGSCYFSFIFSLDVPLSPHLWIREAWWAISLETEQSHTSVFCPPSWHPTPFLWQWLEAVPLSLFGSCL